MPGDITITLPDASTRSYPSGVTAAEIAASIGRGLAKAALAARIGPPGPDQPAEDWIDLNRPIDHDATVAIITPESAEGREVLRHSTAHVLAQAVVDLFPGAKYAIGPAIDNGFYYDFELPDGAHFSEDDLERIEARMREIVAADEPFVREELSRGEALSRFVDQPYKVDIIERVEPSEVGEGSVISVYRNPRSDDGADFLDLCRGPHVPSTKRLGAFKLTKLAGAYWRGDEHGPQLQRVYGTAWESQAALDEHLHQLAEAERRDHRRLGVDLDLFSFPDELGGGLALWHPKGAAVRRVMEDFSRSEHEQAGYELVFTPHVAKSTLWETSGHLGYYAENMYPAMELEGATYYPRPMNCPFHILIYKSHLRSYRELPLKLFELGTVYRYERSGVLHGLLRLRGFTQDDSHIFCERTQIVTVLGDLIDFVMRVLRVFGFEDFSADVSTRPEGKSVGTDDDWTLATNALVEAIEASGLPYKTAEGEGAFYGPKIDIHVSDAIGRRWQLSTLQVDFQNPQRFELEYIGADNERHTPIMIHRALFGSVERFFGILVEHYAGAFPTWLAPVQVVVLPVADRHDDYASQVADRLRSEGCRVQTVDAHADSLGARVRDAKLAKVPHVLVVGDADVDAGTVGVNQRGTEDPERGVALDDFVTRFRTEVAS